MEDHQFPRLRLQRGVRSRRHDGIVQGTGVYFEIQTAPSLLLLVNRYADVCHHHSRFDRPILAVQQHGRETGEGDADG